MKKFRCGLCKGKKSIWRTRKGLRDHLSEEHFIHTEKTNKEGGGLKKGHLIKQNWWIEEEC